VGFSVAAEAAQLQQVPDASSANIVATEGGARIALGAARASKIVFKNTQCRSGRSGGDSWRSPPLRVAEHPVGGPGLDMTC
jgi:hypothetical protein